MGMGPAIFPYDFPTFVVLPAVLIVSYVVRSPTRAPARKTERDAFEAQEIRSETGLGAEMAAAH
jgi:cation/acetate symporter